MSHRQISQEGPSYHPSSTNQDHEDHLMRRRALSCSVLGSGPARSQDVPTQPRAVYPPAGSRPLSQTWLLSSGQIPPGSGFGNYPLNTESPSNGGQGRTQNSLPGSPPQGDSVLGFVPGPLNSEYQQGTPTVSVVSDDRSSLNLTSLECGSMGPMVMITQDPSNPVIVVGQGSPKDTQMIPDALSPSTYPSPRNLSSPSSPYVMHGINCVYLHPMQGSETPSSPSVLSSGSASPLSLSGLNLNSPQSITSEVDEDLISRTLTGQESQAQREHEWKKDGGVFGEVPVSPSSPFGQGNRIESFGGGQFSAVPSTTQTFMMTGLPGAADFDPAGTTGINAAILDPSPVDVPVTILQYPQSFPSESFRPLMEGPSTSSGIDSFPLSPPSPFFPSILPGMPALQQSDGSGPSDSAYPRSDPSDPFGLARRSFSLQVNTGYIRAPLDDYFQGVGTSGPHIAMSNIVPENAYANPGCRLNGASRKKKGGWSNETSRNKELARELNNQLLHISISALQHRGRIPRVSSLRDTLRFIIRGCFNTVPTRQNIVDLLFEALPEGIQMEVEELDVKKYFKDRIGHILSAPPNKKIFINLSGGRWALGEES